MYVKELWRYPVKSMAGEQLQTARLAASGIDGDRIIQVQDARGHTVTSRTYPGLLGLHSFDRRAALDQSRCSGRRAKDRGPRRSLDAGR